MATSTIDPSYIFQNQSSLPPSLATFLTRFYEAWDTDNSDANTDTTKTTPEYLKFWSPTGAFVYGPTPTIGHASIHALRNTFRNKSGPVVGLRHSLDTAFFAAGTTTDAGAVPGKGGELEVLVNGTVVYTLLSGNLVDAAFAALIKLVKRGEGEEEGRRGEWDWVVERVTVYADSARLSKAIESENRP